MGALRSNFLLLVATTAICLFGAEGALRLLGRKPWEVSEQYAGVPVVTVPHETLGWVNKPGEYSYSLTGDGSNIVRYTIGSDGSRKIAGGEGSQKPELWIFGCSFSFGWALTDGEEYPAQLAALQSQYRVRNFSVPGYGTYQSLLRYEELLREGKRAPIVVYGFASFHDERNVAAYEWLKNIRRFGRGQHWVRTPFADLDGEGKLVRHSPVSFTVFPMSEYSDVVTEAQSQWGRMAAGGRAERSREVTLALLKEFSRKAAANESRFLVLALSLPRDGEYYFRDLVQSEIEYVDGARYGELTPERMVPGDWLHPNGRIHGLWAKELAAYLHDPAPSRLRNTQRLALYTNELSEHPSEALHGTIEQRVTEGGDTVIRGWAFDKERPENLVVISARVDGREVGRTVTNISRADVVQVFRIDEFLRPGFEIRVPLEKASALEVIAFSENGGSRTLTDLK